MDLTGLTAFDDLLPPQRPSAHGERLDLSFGPHIDIALDVDAMPGCGGLAWPAGEVDKL